jgi:hypothetical protein
MSTSPHSTSPLTSPLASPVSPHNSMPPMRNLSGSSLPTSASIPNVTGPSHVYNRLSNSIPSMPSYGVPITYQDNTMLPMNTMSSVDPYQYTHQQSHFRIRTDSISGLGQHQNSANYDYHYGTYSLPSNHSHSLPHTHSSNQYNYPVSIPVPPYSAPTFNYNSYFSSPDSNYSTPPVSIPVFSPLSPSPNNYNWPMSTSKIRPYTQKERRDRIILFLEKRSKRNINKSKKVLYQVRKNFADLRTRVGGRFIKKSEDPKLENFKRDANAAASAH